MCSGQREEGMIRDTHIQHSWHLFRLLPVPPELLPGLSLHHSAFRSKRQHLSLLNFTGSLRFPSSHLSK